MNRIRWGPLYVSFHRTVAMQISASMILSILRFLCQHVDLQADRKGIGKMCKGKILADFQSRVGKLFRDFT